MTVGSATDRRVCQRARRVVVKVGTRVLLGDGHPVVDRGVFVRLVQSIANEVRHAGRRLVLVSSGAVGLGRRRLPSARQTRSLAYLQALAALGQSALMQLYEHEFAFHDLLVGQVLLTQADIDDRRRFINARHTLRLLAEELGAVPIVNENDTVANEELRLGDNDRLAALVANLFESDLLIILSDVEGLLSADPRTHPDAQRLPQVRADDPALDALVWRSPTGPGRGGMTTKILAARMAASAGVPTVIAPGRLPDVVSRVLQGDDVGTLFTPATEAIGSRRHWLRHGITTAGRIRVDEGAVKALVERKRSLLPSGVTGVQGEFGVGAAVDIVGPDDVVIARGLTSYRAGDIERIAGRSSTDIFGILGFKTTDEVVHRDDLVVVAGAKQPGSERVLP
jgi:glutamate 5-kinase